MSALSTLVLGNPELIRNLRSQLRPQRMGIAAAITGVVSLIILPTLIASFQGTRPSGWGSTYGMTVLALQSLTLIFGGGTACLQSVSREKELNTFDYQRITRLTPLELAVGKILGAPAMAYFIALCLFPAALVGLASSDSGFGFVLRAYVLLLFGTLMFHTFTVMISMLFQKGVSTGAILIFLLLAGCAGGPTSWMIMLAGSRSTPGIQNIPFYGVQIPSVILLSFIYLSLTAWYLLALMRNLKRDPGDYELYTPGQALGLAAYLNFLYIGFIPSTLASLETTQVGSMWVNKAIFFFLGLALLRNRDRTRRRLRELGAKGLSWLEAFWPAPYLFLGALVTGLMPLVLVDWVHKPSGQGSLFLFLFRTIFFGLWLSRDMLYLQWMNLRPARQPMVRALLYLGVYYLAMVVLFVRSAGVQQPEEAAFKSIFVPFFALLIDRHSWESVSGFWLLAMAMQVGLIFLFAYFHRHELVRMAVTPKAAPPNISTKAPAVAR